jgi:hypothetical protein
MTTDLLGWSSTMTDTIELPRVLRGELQPTMELSILDLPPAPDEAPAPAPQRLPKRLRRRRAYAHLAAAWRHATLTRAALAASTAGLALTGCGAL